MSDASSEAGSSSDASLFGVAPSGVMEPRGLDRIHRHHTRGSLTARERLELLFDDGTFQELDALKAHRCQEFGMETKQFPGDGVVTGHGKVNGRYVYAFSQGE